MEAGVTRSDSGSTQEPDARDDAIIRSDSQSAVGCARKLATAKDAAIRDGKRALEVATRACELSKWQDADCLDTLAAAYAETGDFPAAIKWETKAIELIKADRSHAIDTKEFRMGDRLKLFQKQQPCRE